MRTSLMQRGLGIALALTMVLAAPLTARAEEAQQTELTKEHITLDQTEFEFTGEEIRPNVTVRVEETLLTLDKHYMLDFADNVAVGEGKVIVTGIATGGYTGAVEIPFTILEKTTEPETSEPTQPETTEPTQPEVSQPNEPDNAPPEPIALDKNHIQLDKTTFVYNGEPITPKFTVTVDGKTLTVGKHYTVSYTNNDKPGTGTVTVTAVNDSGYTGSVSVQFTIEEPSYAVTKGNDGKWYQESGKTLSFTVNGAYDKFVGVSVDGKRISDSNYSVKSGSTVVTLKAAYLKTLKLGEHTITFHFTDGKADAAFRVVAGLDASNPSTGDNIQLWVSVLLIASLGLGTVAVRKKLWK